jgi:hypothetical protein
VFRSVPEGKLCSILELATLLAEAVQVVNIRPIPRRKPVEDSLEAGPSPLHTFSWGRASVEIRKVTFDLSPSLTKRLRYLDGLEKEFWKKWMTQVFQG